MDPLDGDSLRKTLALYCSSKEGGFILQSPLMCAAMLIPHDLPFRAIHQLLIIKCVLYIQGTLQCINNINNKPKIIYYSLQHSPE